jgi:3-hydroxyisobutyrate dehydrogenase-like beta-hydroxyacid dehydrogenase
VIAEALVAAEKAGVDLEALYRVVSVGAANSGVFQMVVTGILAGAYDGMRFGLDLARKDLRYYTHLTESLNLPSPLGEAVHQAFVQASALGCGSEMVGGLVKAQERITGEKVARARLKPAAE